MKKSIGVVFVLCMILATGRAWAASAGDYHYISAKDLRGRLDAGTPTMLIDICPAEQFAKGHIKRSIETNAYPVKTDAEKARLAKLLPQVRSSAEDIIIICPRGGGGAKNTVDFYKSHGVDEKRLLILEKGMDQWPYESESK